MMKALIIDDTEMARVALRADIKQYCPEIVVAGEASGVEEGIKMIHVCKPDLIFLDIRMGDGSGFDLLERLGKDVQLKVIFTTAYDEYAIKAFKYSASDYLLKPIDPDELVRAVEKIGSENKNTDLIKNLEFLMQQVKSPRSLPKKLALNSLDKVQLVNISDIVRCESQSNYTIFYLRGNQQILVTRTLKEFDELLSEHNFIRVHHSHLINPDYLKEFNKSEFVAVMTDNTHVPVSVRKKDQLLKFFGL
jgi:two-component system, LytTR family, response regulator